MSWRPRRAPRRAARDDHSKASLRRRLARAGARPALLQALIIAAAFVLAGVLTHAFSDRLQVQAMRGHVLGEVRSVNDEYAHLGAEGLVRTLTKRTRLWRGFSYRMVGPDGRLLAGDLPATGATSGWSHLEGAPQSTDPRDRPYLVYAEALPNGWRVWVGLDASSEALQAHAQLKAAILSGAVGVLFGVCVSYAVSRRAWRRVSAIAEVARQVQGGAADPRAPEPAGEAKDDLDELSLTFNAMLDRTAALMDQVRQVSRDVAHDLRTPLTRVRHRLERLRADTRHEPVLALRIEQVEADVGEILRTFDALLQLAEIEAERREGDRLFDLGETAARVGEAFRPDVEDGGRSLRITASRAMVAGHERLVSQAVANLIENAARHTPAGSQIALEVLAEPSPQLVVTDDGPGIACADREAVLRPMVRLEASRHLSGSGLGLSIVSAVAARHQARLELADAGPGLRATLTFQSPPSPRACTGSVATVILDMA